LSARVTLAQCERRFLNETPFASMPGCRGDGGRARILKRSAMKPMTRSMNFWNWRFPMRQGPAHCRAFMAWLRTADLEVKRDMKSRATKSAS